MIMTERKHPPRSLCWLAAMLIALVFPVMAYADSGSAKTVYQQGRTAIERDDYTAALRHFTQAIQLDPHLAEAWVSRAWVYNQLDRPNEEIADLTRFLQLAPDDAEAYCNRGAAYARTGRFKNALADADKAVALDPKLADAWATRAWIHSEMAQPAKAVADYTHALQLAPDDTTSIANRAKCLRALGENSRAIADFDRALAATPKDPDLLGCRGAAKAALGDMSGAADDLAAAIAANPHDVGAEYATKKEADLSPQALKHGETQLQKMLQDRPGLAKHLKPGGPLWKWAVHQMAGQALGEPIDWDPTPPADSEAEHVAPGDGYRGRIRVKPYDNGMPNADPDRIFELLWSHIVYELHNIGHVPRFEQLREQAARGRISKHQFVERIFHYEHEAIQQTRAFYVKVQLPWAAEKGLKSDADLWFANLWLDVDAAMDGFTDLQQYPWKPYSRQYDWLRAHAQIDKEEYREALTRLQTMAGEDGYPDDLSHVHYWIAECQLALNDLQAALKAASAAIAADPKDVHAYELRAEVYEELGEAAKAAADLATVRRLDAEAEQH